MVNWIGGSGYFTRNAYLSIFVARSVVKENFLFSRIGQQACDCHSGNLEPRPPP